MAENFIVPLNVEFVEYAVRDLATASKMYDRLGFSCVGLRNEPGRHSKLYMQGDVRIVLTASDSERDPAHRFVSVHGDGVLNVGLRVANVEEALQLALRKGAVQAHGQQEVLGRDGALMRNAAIQVFGDCRHTFLSYEGSARYEDFFPEEFKLPPSLKGKFVQTVDHITVNVERGQVDRWAKFYGDVFGMQEVRYFDIKTDRSGLFSRAMRTPNGRLTIPFNEATDDKSQIQEFINTFKGPGIQHLALHTSNIVLCLREMLKQGFKFLSVPTTYYDAIPKRVPNITEDLEELKSLNILVDGSEKGYLLQIFTEPVVGPFFFELIQRKGDQGFGEGNFRALFEAIERDQLRRGVI